MTLLDVECYDLSRATTEDIAEECSVLDSISAALKARSTAVSVAESAIYVISEVGNCSACKVGVARNPVTRLESLQCGNWRELRVNSLFWVVEGPVYGLESLALRIAKKMRKVLRGEWLDMEPSAAAYIVAAAAQSARFNIADSDMWLRQRAAIHSEAAKLLLREEENKCGVPRLATSRVDKAILRVAANRA